MSEWQQRLKARLFIGLLSDEIQAMAAVLGLAFIHFHSGFLASVACCLASLALACCLSWM